MVTGARGATTGANNPGGVYATATLSTHQGWQEVDYLANQTNLFAIDIGGHEHASFRPGIHRPQVLNGVYNVANSGQNCITGTGTTRTPGASWPDGMSARPQQHDEPPDRQGQLGQRLGRQDRLRVGHGHLRPHRIRHPVRRPALRQLRLRPDTQNTAAGAPGATTTPTACGTATSASPASSAGCKIYASAATAADINGGESDVGTSGGYGGTIIYNGQVAGAEPESSDNLELGTKWNLLDDKLLLTAALFQITKSDVMEGADYTSVGTFNTGENRCVASSSARPAISPTS